MLSAIVRTIDMSKWLLDGTIQCYDMRDTYRVSLEHLKAHKAAIIAGNPDRVSRDKDRD